VQNISLFLTEKRCWEKANLSFCYHRHRSLATCITKYGFNIKIN